MSVFSLIIVTPNGKIFENDVHSVTLPGKEGEFGVLSGHVSLLSLLSVGVILIEKQDYSKELVAINWDYVKINDARVTVLVDDAVALAAETDSEVLNNIKYAKDLVRSVGDSNIALAAVEARIDSFRLV